jgi:ribosome recycling factor
MKNYDFLNTFTCSLEKSVLNFEKTIANIKVGRHSPELFESLEVSTINGVFLIKQLATVTIKNTDLVIMPWDNSNVKCIKKSIEDSNFGFTPMVDGYNIRIPMPIMTKERREQMEKVVSIELETTCTQMRRLRFNIIKDIKIITKLSEDIVNGLLKNIDIILEKFTKKVKFIAKNKIDSFKL